MFGALYASDGPVDRARSLALAVNNGIAGAWLVGPSDEEEMVEAGAVATALALRLGIDVIPSEGPDGLPFACPAACAVENTLDAAGLHALGCVSGRTARHNAARDAARQKLAGALPAGRVDIECAVMGPADLAPHRARKDQGELAPGDLVVCTPGALLWTYLDFRVEGLRADLLQRAARDGQTLHRSAYDAKLRGEGARLVQASGHRFVPVAAGAFGDLDARSVAVLNALAAAADAASPRGRRGRGLPAALRRAVVAAVVFGGARAVNALLARTPLPPPPPQRTAEGELAVVGAAGRLADALCPAAA